MDVAHRVHGKLAAYSVSAFSLKFLQDSFRCCANSIRKIVANKGNSVTDNIEITLVCHMQKIILANLILTCITARLKNHFPCLITHWKNQIDRHN